MNGTLKQQVVMELLKALTDEKMDSLELGNSRTGSVKVYFDASKPDEARAKVQAAIDILLEKRGQVYSQGGGQ